MTIDGSVKMAEAEISEVFAYAKEGSEEDTGIYRDVIGTCPLCGKNVISFGSFYGCEGYKDGCKFHINSVICGKTISVSLVRALIENGKTELIKGFKSKKGNSFDAYLSLNKEGGVDFTFPDRPAMKERRDEPKKLFCPVCGKPILKGKTAYGCEGWKDGCTFRFPFVSDDNAENEKALNESLEASYLRRKETKK